MVRLLQPSSKRQENSATLQRMVESMFASIDSDGSGAITVDEMVDGIIDELKDIHMYLMMPDTPRFDRTKVEMNPDITTFGTRTPLKIAF